MKGGNARRARHILLGILIGGAMFVAPRFASAATLSVSPASGPHGVGAVFPVTMKVNSQGTAVNAIEGTLSFNTSVLQVISISAAGSIFNLNVQDPEFSNTAGTVKWTGVILNPGYNGPSGTLITVNFKGISQGVGQVSYASAAVLANDGQGSNVLTGTSGGTYQIGPATSPTPTPAITPAPASDLPDVTSPTHPDTGLWYSNNDPVFEWKLPAGVDGVSYIVNPKPGANPGNQSDGLKETVQFTDIPNGANYFHIKFLRNGVWGPVKHFAFNVDIELPESFAITRVDGDDPTNPQPKLTFVDNDAVSGVAKYLMRIGDGDWFPVDEAPVGHPFIMPLQAPGTHEVTIEAVDRAGNSTQATLAVVVVSIQRPVITRYPAQADAHIPFPVEGEAGPDVTVRLKAYRSSALWGHILYSDEVVASVDTTANGAGHWTANMTGLPNGVYRLEANAIDDRGAISDTSAPVTVRVGYGFIRQTWDGVRSLFGGGDWWPWLLWLLLLCLLAYGLWRLWLLFWKRDDDKVPDKLRELLADMDDELALIAQVAKHRALYPEEQYLRSKLVQYRRNLKILVTDTHSRLAKKK